MFGRDESLLIDSLKLPIAVEKFGTWKSNMRGRDKKQHPIGSCEV
jgi:hypothetical protein